jgi:hypothetical protein
MILQVFVSMILSSTQLIQPRHFHFKLGQIPEYN